MSADRALWACKHCFHVNLEKSKEQRLPLLPLLQKCREAKHCQRCSKPDRGTSVEVCGHSLITRDQIPLPNGREGARRDPRDLEGWTRQDPKNRGRADSEGGQGEPEAPVTGGLLSQQP